MTPELTHFLNHLITASEFASIPAVLLIVWRWKGLSYPQRLLGIVIGVICLNQLVAVCLVYFFEAPNLPLYHIYLLVEGPGILLVFRYRFRGHWLYRALPWLAGALGLFTLVNAGWIQGWNALPSYPRTAEALLVCLLALYYFRYVFNERKVAHLDRSFWFWLSAGLLIYFSSNLLLFMFSNWLFSLENRFFLGVWSIHASLNFVLYGFYIIAYLCPDREYSYSSSSAH